eukprot:Phypoly_transcript_20799.p1 GENE.Phypoly_transcript_20799~~Phypoly_transcript_20799.p1  ORF type:complete len:176 (+),score=41.76 Phypoly_transcript_20799:88-615(+)
MGDAVEYDVDVLFAAGKRNNTALLNEYIAQKGPKVDLSAVDSLGNSALHYSSGSNHHDVTELLLSKGANPNLQNKTSGETPLHRAAWGNHTDLVKLLIAHGANPTIANKNGQKPVQVAKTKELRAIIESAVMAHNIDASDIADDDDDEDGTPAKGNHPPGTKHEHDKDMIADDDD